MRSQSPIAHKYRIQSIFPTLAAMAILSLAACSTNKQPSVPKNCTAAQVKDYNRVVLNFDDRLETLCTAFKSRIGDQTCVAENNYSGKTMRISASSVDDKCSKDKINLFRMVNKNAASAEIHENSTDMTLANSVFQDGRTGVTAEFICMARDSEGALHKETVSLWVDKSGSRDGQAWQYLKISGDLFKTISGEIAPGSITKSNTTTVLVTSAGYGSVAVLNVNGKSVTGVKSLAGISKTHTEMVRCE